MMNVIPARPTADMPTIKPAKPIGYFPWRSGNQFQLFIDGNQFFPRMLDAIQQARFQIDLEMYLFESGQVADEFIAHLLAARSRGVRVRLLLDAVGSLFLKTADRDTLRGGAVELQFYNSLATSKWLRNLARDHRKILTIDQRLAFVGGAGITDDFHPAIRGTQAWRELMLEISGPVVHDWCSLFELTWQQPEGPLTMLHWTSRLALRDRSSKRQPRIPGQTPQARVNRSRGMGYEPIKGALIAELEKARYYAWISTAYFHPPWRLRHAMIKAAKRDVDVRLLLPGPRTDHPAIRYAGQNYYSELLKAGVRIYEYQPSFLHMKAAIIDDWCSIGSCNFDRWNLRWNLEANQEILDYQLAEKARQMLVADFSRSRLIDPAYWQHRPWHQRIKEQFWHGVSMRIDRWINQ
jgi:phosphatidylserine/phosphatidylglycerophosphate/cardiolipin synthase-like enzyme